MSKVSRDLLQLDPLPDVFQKIQDSAHFAHLIDAMRAAFRQELQSESAEPAQSPSSANSFERLENIRNCLQLISRKIGKHPNFEPTAWASAGKSRSIN